MTTESPKEIIATYELLIRKIAGKIARGLASKGVSVIDADDLYSIGCAEALAAVACYDASRNTKRSTWVANLVRRALTRESLRALGLKRTLADAAMSRAPLEESLAEQLREARARAFVSIDDAGLESEPSWTEANEDRLKWLSEAVRTLPAIERAALAPFFDPTATLRSVGEERGVCRERTRQLQVIAIKKLQKAARIAGL